MNNYLVRRSLLVALSLVFLTGLASAAWSIDALNTPYSHLDVSDNTSTVQIVNVTDSNSDPVNRTELENADNTAVNYIYPSGGNKVEMSWLDAGYYYAEFDAESLEGDSVTYEIFDSSADGGTIDSASQTLNFGNMTVDILNDFSSPVKFGKTVKMEVNVTDDFNDTHEDQADVSVYFTNGTWTSQVHSIDNHNDEDLYYFNSEVKLPSEPGSDYVIHANATRNNAGYNDSYGSQSIAFETLPEIQGEIESLNASSGCNNESFFTECQRDAVIETGFNITESDAENVNLSIEIKNRTSGKWEENTTTELTQEDGLYTGKITVPDVNTSEYEKTIRLKYNASNQERTEIVKRDLSYRDFRIVDKSNSVTGPGNYAVKLEIRKYFTPELLENSRIKNSLVQVREPSGDLLTSFTVTDDMERKPDPGHYKRTIDIPVSAEKGIYDMIVEVNNTYDEQKTETFNFNVTDIEKTFEINEGEDDFEKTVDKTGNHSFNVTAENMINAENNISTEVSGEIENFTTVNNGTNISLDAEESENITIEFDVDSVDQYSGEIKFMDEEANYNWTMDVALEHTSCDHREETICVTGDDLNASTDESGDIVKEFTVINFGEKDEEYSVSASLSGNVTSYSSLNESSVDLNTENDSRQVELTYSATAPGFYSGTLSLSNSEDTLDIPVSLDSDVEATDAGISISEVELGELDEGATVTHDVEVENTGDFEITDVEFSSDTYTVSGSADSIAPGDTETVSVEFSNVESDSGTLEVTGQTGSGEVSASTPVTATVVPDYEARASELEQRLLDLDSRVESDSSLQTELNNLQPTISDIKTAYNQGDYERAQSLYRDASTTLDSVERELASQDQQNNNNANTNQTTDNGGFPILPLAAAIFVILLVGFVAYTSIEPEEGDPLYNVLGQ